MEWNGNDNGPLKMTIEVIPKRSIIHKSDTTTLGSSPRDGGFEKKKSAAGKPKRSVGGSRKRRTERGGRLKSVIDDTKKKSFVAIKKSTSSARNASVNRASVPRPTASLKIATPSMSTATEMSNGSASRNGA